MKAIVNKRRFLAALSVVLLISAALVVASCLSPLDEISVQQQKGNNNKTPPVGKGLITISVSDAARTIMPTIPAREGLWYTVQFVGDNPANSLDYPEITDTSTDSRATYTGLTTAAIALVPDDYHVVITAWDSDGLDSSNGSGDGVGLEIAGWTAPSKITVSSGSSSSISAVLSGFVGGGTGSFYYNIVVPALPLSPGTWGGSITLAPSTYTSAVMKIFKGATQQGGNIDLTPTTLTSGETFTDTINLSVGYYTVDIELAAANCQSRKGTYVLHIYKDQTSSFTYNIPTLNQNLFAVAFDKQLDVGETDTSGILATTQTGISNAGTVTALSGNPSHSLGFDFLGWFDNALGSGSAWVFGAASGTKVFKDTTLYAKWNKGLTFTISIVEDVGFKQYVNDSPAALGSGSYSYAGFESGTVLSFVVDNASDYEDSYNVSTLVWKFDGFEVATGDTLLINKTTLAEILPSTSAPFLTLFVSGTREITVRGINKDTGVTFDGKINIVVNN